MLRPPPQAQQPIGMFHPQLQRRGPPPPMNQG